MSVVGWLALSAAVLAGACIWLLEELRHARVRLGRVRRELHEVEALRLANTRPVAVADEVAAYLRRVS